VRYSSPTLQPPKATSMQTEAKSKQTSSQKPIQQQEIKSQEKTRKKSSPVQEESLELSIKNEKEQQLFTSLTEQHAKPDWIKRIFE